MLSLLDLLRIGPLKAHKCSGFIIFANEPEALTYKHYQVTPDYQTDTLNSFEHFSQMFAAESWPVLVEMGKTTYCSKEQSAQSWGNMKNGI